MTNPVSPFEINPPSSRQLLKSIVIALTGALFVLVFIVLPAEYGIDPTGVGGALGLTALHDSKRTIQIKDVIGGNERFREIKVANADDPVPLPNPAVFQRKSIPPRSQTVTVHLKPGQETEIKAVLEASQVMIYSWRATGGEVYTDFHGHEPGADNGAWVRYDEQQSGDQGSGSLVAPFSGEHGWYWVNIGDKPVEITLTLSGYYSDYIDYGLLGT